MSVVNPRVSFNNLSLDFLDTNDRAISRVSMKSEISTASIVSDDLNNSGKRTTGADTRECVIREPEAGTPINRFAVHLAARGGEVHLLRSLVGQPGEPGPGQFVLSNLEADYNGFSPLHWAAKEGHTQCVEFLLDMGARVNEKNGHGDSPLLLAALSGSLGAVKALLEGGADIHGLNPMGKTPLECAKQWGHEHVAKYLMNMVSRQAHDRLMDEFARRPGPPPLADPKKCEARGSGLTDAYSRTMNSFVVVSRDAQGQPRRRGGDRFEIVMTGPNSVVPTIQDNKDGSYTVSYFTTVSGDYTIKLMYKGRNIKGFPCVVHVGVGDNFNFSPNRNSPKNLKNPFSSPHIESTYDKSIDMGVERYIRSKPVVRFQFCDDDEEEEAARRQRQQENMRDKPWRSIRSPKKWRAQHQKKKGSP